MVRDDVQEGLLPAPLGVGRGQHYGPAHLERLLQVKALQEGGRTLEDIRRTFARGAPRSSADALPPPAPPVTPRSLWRRFVLAPGVELHVASAVRLPSPGRLHELEQWCRVHFPGDAGHGGDDE